MALERMESNIMAVLRHDMECIAAIHCLKVYCQRLGCDLSDGAAVRRAAGCAFALATEALSDMAILQFPPSLTAAAILVAARRAQASPPHHAPLPPPHHLGMHSLSLLCLFAFPICQPASKLSSTFRGCKALMPLVCGCAGVCTILAVCVIPANWVHRGEQPTLCLSYSPRRPPLQQAVHLCRGHPGGRSSHGTCPSMTRIQAAAVRF